MSVLNEHPCRPCSVFSLVRGTRPVAFIVVKEKGRWKFADNACSFIPSSHLYRNMPESAFIREIVGSCNTWIKKCVSINVIFGYKGGQGYLISTKKPQNNYSFNWANDESFWSQNKVTSPGMRTLKNSYNNGNRSARSVFVVSWNLLLTRAGFFFLSAWNIYSVLTSANNKS